MEILGANPSQP